MMLSIAPGWSAEVERGPDWLFVKLRSSDPFSTEGFSACERIWGMLEQEFINRLVLEMDGVPMLPSQLIGELVLLHKRISSRGGLMRLSGLSDRNYSALRLSRLNDRFPQYESREHAVMGNVPNKPR